MEATTIAARRTEDIALDLLKFVAAHANLANKATGSTGFAAAPSTKPEDQVTQLLDLYARCRQAVEAPIK
ncbi:MAG TPA: hypothetical protein VGB69_06595 [Edaphobacter sp.]